MKNLSVVIVSALLLTGCFGKDEPPRVRIEYQDRLVETVKPCPAEKPERPAKLARPLPGTPAQLIDVLVAKLTEWAGPGGYGEKADAVIDSCIKGQ
jgi:hypothetical protein